MLIFGSCVCDWKDKAAYAQEKGENEFAQIREVRCEGIENVDEAFAAMAAFNVGTKCRDFLYHATVNLNPGERLTQKQWAHAVDTLEKALNLEGHYRVVFEHIKKDRQHYHIVWSRIPPDGGNAVNMWNDYAAHGEVAQQLEQEFGLTPAPRKATDKPTQRKKQEIETRNSRLRVEPEIVTAEVTEAYRTSGTSSQFLKALAKKGYTLCRGKKNSLVLVDKQGGYHGLLRRIEGVKVKDLRHKMPALEKMDLPDLNAVLRLHRSKAKTHYGKAVKTFSRPISSGRIAFAGCNAGRAPSVRGVSSLSQIRRAVASEKVVQQSQEPFKPIKATGGWPEAAVQDWEAWGHKEPVRFFLKWPELRPDGFVMPEHLPH